MNLKTDLSSTTENQRRPNTARITDKKGTMYDGKKLRSG